MPNGRIMNCTECARKQSWRVIKYLPFLYLLGGSEENHKKVSVKLAGMWAEI